ncbi:unnamed protein product [Adineta steineri]|uniref:UDP-N-acetylglucosamine--peptide N-acetylglucosaminyltransferase SPINDLY n=1 Tax=Adineta steineri TaxID=433720 RepID=A0A819X7C2_9BILA|nr:unnamed protein product [Adineta steineri]CAF4131902.1 unnamed protein product [Adineta steineri]
MGNGCTSTKSIQTNAQPNAKHVSKFSKDALAHRRMNMQRLQNVLLIWLDNKINENNADCRNTIKQLKRVVNNVNTFSDDGECIEFIQTINNNKVCMIVSESLGYRVVPHVHDMSQVDTIFIFCNNQEWVKEWPKIKGVFTDITSICEALKQVAHQCEQNSISISIVAPNKKLDQLDPSFMYTQILNEILLTINFEDKHFKQFITYCRGVYEDDEHELKNVNQLQATYKNNMPIWWYTWDAFLYRMLNQALRTTDVDIIVRMGFFIKDLHHDIQRLHSEQFDGHQSGETLILYRGQGLSKEDFTEMTNTKGGLLSFNSFLATSENRNISLNFAQQAATNPDLVGILFVISTNPSGSTTPFASVSDVSYFHTEEVLFSMHTIFRIGDIKPIDGDSNLYEANLILTSDNDQDLRTLNDQIRQETFPDEEGWYRLGELLIKTGQSNKAQEVYEVLLHQKTDESDEACIYNQLGSIKYNQEEYPEALTYFEKSLAINQKILPSNHLNLAMSYNNIGLVYYSMGDYPKALSSLEKALANRQQLLPSNHPHLGASYLNIGNVYSNTGDYPKALSYYEKALANRQQSLPSNHPDLGASYLNIGNVYSNTDDYPKTLSYYKKALTIQRQSLPSSHSDLALAYNNIGNVYTRTGDYPKALSSHEKALAIRQQSLPSNHLDLGNTYHNIGDVYYSMNDYPKALSSYEKAFAIQQQSLPSNHPDLASSYIGIGNVYGNMGDYPKALSYYEKALGIQQQSLSSSHPDLGMSYNNIGNVYNNMGDYPKALSNYEIVLAIRQLSLPSNHPDLAVSYMNIGAMYNNMGDYSKALLSYKNALAIQKQSLPSNHSDLCTSYMNIGAMYNNMGDYPKALSYYEKTLGIQQQSLPSSHPDLGDFYMGIGNVYNNVGDYPKALSNYEKALAIRQQSLPPNHPELGNSYNNIGSVYNNMSDYPKALSSYKKALAIRQQSLTSNHPHLGDSY